MKTIQDAMSGVLIGALKKRHPLMPKLLLNWEKIVGAEYASLCWPQKISSVKERGEKLSLLHIKASDSVAAMRLNFLQDVITERIAIYLGHRAIDRVRITLSR